MKIPPPVSFIMSKLEEQRPILFPRTCRQTYTRSTALTEFIADFVRFPPPGSWLSSFFDVTIHVYRTRYHSGNLKRVDPCYTSLPCGPLIRCDLRLEQVGESRGSDIVVQICLRPRLRSRLSSLSVSPSGSRLPHRCSSRGRS